MKVKLAMLIASFILVSCNPQKQYDKIIQDLGYISYRTPLSSVGTGTIIKGPPKNLMVFAPSEQCLPNRLPDGSLTGIRFIDDTDLPHHVKEAKLNFSGDLSFFGSNGNPLFTVNPSASYVKKVEAKFSGEKIEFINELRFWHYFENHMDEDCKAALLKYPLFWKSLKVEKMEFTFKNEAGAAIKLSAPMIKEIISLNVDVNWSISNEFTLTIESPKYIGFFAVQLTEESVRTHSATRYSNRVDSKGNYIWNDIKAKDGKPNVLQGRNTRPLY